MDSDSGGSVWGGLSALFGAATSFFTPAKEKEKKKGVSRKRSVESDHDDFHVGPVDEAPPVPAQRTRKSAAEKREEERAADREVVESLDRSKSNLILSRMYAAAQEELDRCGRERFSKNDIGRWLLLMQSAVGEPDLSWDNVRRRCQRVREKGSAEQAEGGGRKSKFTAEVEEAAVRVARSYGGEVSATRMYEEVAAELGPDTIKKSQFIHHIASSGRFKARRIHYKPLLTPTHMQNRVDYSNAILAAPENEERTVFVDEKRFESISPGTLTLPVEDSTPTRFAQSRTNSSFVMVLVAVMKPRGDFNGLVGLHPFTQIVNAVKKSKNREKGTPVLKAVNVSRETYIKSWKETVFPELRALIDEWKIATPTEENPLLLQDDNAKPHRAELDGVKAMVEICQIGLQDFGIHIRPADPLQPAQSPDTNPLDTFVFRLLNLRFRRLRAQSRAAAAAAGLRVRGPVHFDDDVADVELDENGVEGEGEEAGNEDDAEGFVIHKPNPVPMRCNAKKMVCGGCSKIVRAKDQTARKCDLRGGVWHLECVLQLLGKPKYENAISPVDVAENDVWICPQ